MDEKETKYRDLSAIPSDEHGFRHINYYGSDVRFALPPKYSNPICVVFQYKHPFSLVYPTLWEYMDLGHFYDQFYAPHDIRYEVLDTARYDAKLKRPHELHGRERIGAVKQYVQGGTCNVYTRDNDVYFRHTQYLPCWKVWVKMSNAVPMCHVVNPVQAGKTWAEKMWEYHKFEGAPDHWWVDFFTEIAKVVNADQQERCVENA